MDSRGHNICDYSDTNYEAFWQENDRDYEDAVERMALRRLTGDMKGSCVEIGGGYGRLLGEYASKCSRVILTDYAENLLRQAEARARDLGLRNVECRRINLYELGSFVRNFDNAVCVRVMHHVENVPDFFAQVNLALRSGGTFIFEYANKKNVLEIMRFILRRPNIRPFDHMPTKRKSGVYYNFHPAYIREMLAKSGFVVEEELAVSIFRCEKLKKLFGSRMLESLERFLQKPLARLHPSPSVFVRARKVHDLAPEAPAEPAARRVS